MDWVAGVDGCPGGWVSVCLADDLSSAHVCVHARFAAIAAIPELAILAVDMPIGLPDRIGRGGRGPEQTLRPLLGARRSSVFSMPARAAVEAQDYASACLAALATSEPPRKISRQAFGLFPKIRELDALLRGDTALAARVFECHPEATFALLKDAPLTEPKKIKSRVWPAGLAERRDLLMRAGFPAPVLAQPVPRGAAPDDLLDACACALTALRIRKGAARRFPAEPDRDRHGLLVAIHA